MANKEAIDAQKLQQKYVELQMLDRQMKQVQDQIAQVEEQVQDLEGLQENLDELKDIKEGAELRVPIASGIFAKAKLTDSKNLLVNVGASTVVERTSEQAKELLAKQSMELQKLHATLAQKLAEMGDRAADLSQELQKAMSAQQS